tara:strand:- start:199 stop:324 length:126 start_codon:yes stop_codon:yes gene_type:complete
MPEGINVVELKKREKVNKKHKTTGKLVIMKQEDWLDLISKR